MIFVISSQPFVTLPFLVQDKKLQKVINFEPTNMRKSKFTEVQIKIVLKGLNVEQKDSL